MKWYCMLLYCFVLHDIAWYMGAQFRVQTGHLRHGHACPDPDPGSVLPLVYLSFVLYWSMGLPLLNLSLEPYLDLLKKWQTMAMVFHVMEWNCMVYLGACCKASNVDVILDKL